MLEDLYAYTNVLNRYNFNLQISLTVMYGVSMRRLFWAPKTYVKTDG